MSNEQRDRRRLLRALYANAGIGEESEARLKSAPRGQTSAVSPAQHRLWFEHQLYESSPLMNDLLSVRVLGDALNVDFLRRALAEIVRRHEILRSSFEDRDGLPVLVPGPTFEPSIRELDLRTIPPESRPLALGKARFEELEERFDLAGPPLFRVSVIRYDEAETILTLTMHHIISDATSYDVFFREMGQLYSMLDAGAEPRLPELPFQYADFAGWRAQTGGSARARAMCSRSADRLTGAPARLALGGLSELCRAERGAVARLSLPDDCAQTVGRLCLQEGVTVFELLLSSFAVLLSAETGETDLVIGTPVSSRAQAGLESLIGLFLHINVVRIDLSGGPTFRSLLHRARASVEAARRDEELPLQALMREMRARGSELSIQAFMGHMSDMIRPPSFPHRKTELLDIETRHARFELSLLTSETGGRLGGYFEHRTAVYDEEAGRRLASRFESLVVQCSASPDLPIERFTRQPGS